MKQLCKYPSCGKEANENGYCDKHQQYKRNTDAYRKRLEVEEARNNPTPSRAYQSLYQSYRWKKIRARQIKEWHYCQLCGSTIPPFTVHHVFPHHGNETLFFAGPFMTLCKSCHSRITLEEQRMNKKNGS